MSNWQLVLMEPAKTVMAQISSFLVNLLLALIILLVGWIISRLLKTVITKVLKAVKVDELSERIELDAILTKGGITYSLSELIGVVCYWLAILITIVVSLTAINIITPILLDRIVSYIPNVIAAMFVLVLGMFIAKLLNNIVQTAATNAGLPQAKLLSNVVRGLVIFFAIAISLEQLNIGAKVIELIIAIVLGAIGLAVALAFGLGCKEIAAKFMADLIEKSKKK